MDLSNAYEGVKEESHRDSSQEHMSPSDTQHVEKFKTDFDEADL